jgi:hypothetical protein
LTPAIYCAIIGPYASTIVRGAIVSNWKSALKADPIPWLLEPDGSAEPSSRAQAEGLAEVNPSVRY